jgi:hypothetical protein
MITNEMIAYGKGYEACREDELVSYIQSLQTEALRLSRGYPELSEGIQLATDILLDTHSRRSPRTVKRKKRKSYTSLI